MSLIIKGMQLPRKSERRECSIAVVQNRPVSIAFSRTETNPFGCFECAEIPTPHGRLIDADKLVWFIDNHIASGKKWVEFETIKDMINSLPTIIEAEVSE